MVGDPAGIRRTFGELLEIDEVLPFGDTETDPEDYVTFEWIGSANYLNEQVAGRPRTRGANYTSTDAAIRYVTTDGVIEIALIEWKYTEQYHGHQLGGGENAREIRTDRYQALWADPNGPIRSDRIAFADLLVEPFYQLMRQQLLAHAMEQAHEGEAERIRVVYAAPPGNVALWTSVPDAFKGASLQGADVVSIWTSLLRRPDRFAYFDTSRLVGPGAATSAEFRGRYGHMATPLTTDAISPANISIRPSAIPRLRSALEAAQTAFANANAEASIINRIAQASEGELETVSLASVLELAARLEESAELVRSASSGVAERIWMSLEAKRSAQ
jgi:hypothetical protein